MNIHCRTCGMLKARTRENFYFSDARAGTLHNQCIPCVKEIWRDRYRSEPTITPRMAATEAGEKRYIGSPCKCGSSLRATCSGHCINCERARKRGSTTELTPAQKAARAAAASERRKRMFEQDPERVRAAGRRGSSMRRATERSATPAWFDEWHRFVHAEACHVAAVRTVATGIPWAVDHMLPMKAATVCGLHVAENLQVIPARINNGKNSRLILTEPMEWLRAI